MTRSFESAPVRSAVAKFAASGLVIVVLLGVVGVELLQRTGTREAIRDATEVTRLAGRGIVQPVVSDALLRGDHGAFERVDRTVRAHVLRNPVVRVKIWTPDGRIVYSDERRLVGARYPLGDEEREAIEHGSVAAEVSDLAKPENRFERRHKKLLEVYFPIHTRSGRKLLFEAYLRYHSVAASGRSIWLAFAPAILGALLLLWLVQLPLSWGMARRIREGQVEREALLRRALDASDLERRRIARDLHDGVVRSLAGVSDSLAAAAEEDGEPQGAAIRQAATETRRTIRELRSLLVEIYPPDLQHIGLPAAIEDLVAPFRQPGVETHVDIPEDLGLPPAAESLFFRVIQEALRNTLAHADARRVDVRVRRDDGHATLTVADDGRGFEVEGRPEGHFGLWMIEDAVRDAGGELTVESVPGSGTRVHAAVQLS
jgi:signal transduction histidine kinase